MKHIFLSLAFASWTVVSWATHITIVNNTGHRVTLEPVYNQLVLGKKGTGVPQVIATGKFHIYQEVNLKNIYSYRVHYTKGLRSYMGTVSISGEEIAQRVAQVNAQGATITLRPKGLLGTGIVYTINTTDNARQMGTTQLVELEDSFVDVGMEDPLEILRLYETIGRNPDDPAHVLLDLEQPPVRPKEMIYPYPYYLREYFDHLNQRMAELKEYYIQNRQELDRYYGENFNITDYTDKALALRQQAYEQVSHQLFGV